MFTRRQAGRCGFALRRTHGIDASMKVARSNYLAGFGPQQCVGRQEMRDSNSRNNGPFFCHQLRIDAFRSHAASFPETATLLIDTYNTVAGARKAVEVAQEMAARGQNLKGVRSDIGDLAGLAIKVRKISDDAGFRRQNCRKRRLRRIRSQRTLSYASEPRWVP